MRLRALFAALVMVAGVGAMSLAEAQSQSGAAPRVAAQKKGRAATPPPAPIPVGPPAFAPPVGTDPLVYAVQPYAMYQTAIGDMRGGSLRSQRDLDQALDKVAAHNRHLLSRGLIAYGAMTAAQSPAFVNGVRETAAFYGRDGFIRGLMFDHGYARTLKGAPEAEQLLLAAIGADGDRVIRIGDQYKDQAFAVQRERWGATVAQRMSQRGNALRALADAAGHTVPAPDLAARLSPTALSVSPTTDPSAFGGAWFWDMLRASPQNTAVQTSMAVGPPSIAMAPVDRTLAINQMMTLAALYALDATKDPQVPVADLLTETNTVNCFEMVQTQLRQCTSAARFHFESAFCLAEQGLQNMGKCIRDGRLNTTTANASTP